MRYTLAQASRLLACGSSTLRRWRQQSAMKLARDPTEWRCKWMSEAQIAALARMHKRVVVIQQHKRAPD